MTMLALLQSSTYGSEGSGFGIGSAIFMLVVLAFAILVIAAFGRYLTKPASRVGALSFRSTTLFSC